MTFLTDLFSAGVRIAVPIAFAAVGETYSERAGVINIGLEGMMLSGAFAAVLASDATGDPWIGLLAAVLAGWLLGLIHAFVTITLRGDQIVSGIAINLFAFGITASMFRVVFEGRRQQAVPGFDPVAIPWLSEIPLVGAVFFKQTIVAYMLYMVVIGASFFLYRTRWGLHVQGTGESPLAVDAAGISVVNIRFQCVMLAGILAGLGGGALALSQLRFFTEAITGGRGFIALAAVIFGGWRPGRVALAAGFFGTIDALQLRLQVIGTLIPARAMTMLPYVATILVLSGIMGRFKARMPAHLARVYVREES